MFRLLYTYKESCLIPSQHQPQQLLLEAVAHAKEGKAPTDEHALDVRLANSCPEAIHLMT